jgi:ADP-heptose:LPS heptosyltransferase
MWNRFVTRILLKALKRGVGKRRPEPFHPAVMERVKRILLITTTAIGDTMFSTPAIRAVKETYPGKEVHVLCHIRNRPLLEENPYVDRLFFFHGKAKRMISLLRILKGQHYDLVIILHGNDPEAIPLAWSTGAPYLIGSGGSRFAFALSRGVVCTDGRRHAIEQRLDLVRAIGAETEKRNMDLFLPKEWESLADRILGNSFADGDTPLIGFHPTGSGSYKWWPAEYFAKLGERLIAHCRARFVIISSKGEGEVARSIALRLQGRALLTEGRFDLMEVACLIKKCRLFIANDSGPLHMALALGVPTLALIGADSPLRIGPYQVENGRYLYRKDQVCNQERCLNRRCFDNRCLKAILLEEVFEAARDHLDKRLQPDCIGGRKGSPTAL